MSGPRPIGSNVPATQPQGTSGVDGGPPVGETTTAQPTQGQPAVQPDTTKQTAEQTKGAQQHAFAKDAEAKLSTQARGLAPPPTKEQTIRGIATAAKQLGLEEKEVTKLTDRLKGLNDQDFKEECRFFNAHLIGFGNNTNRALRTYNELKSMQDQNPDRLTNDHIHTLTRGVGESRTSSPKGWEGVLGQDGAINAANSLIDMPKADYDVMNRMLNQAGKDKNGKQIPNSSPQMEKALILKAAGARNSDLTTPAPNDQLLNLAGSPSAAMSTIAQFAKDIRGSKREVLATQSTATDPYEGNKALQQRWTHSCAPTTAQTMKAEIDPIYARKLHQEFIHGTSTSGKIAAEQKKELENHGGVAIEHGKSGGVGSNMGDVLTAVCTPYTGVKYTQDSVGNTVASRNKALDSVAERLSQGIDVPIRVAWPSGNRHAMILTDVRGEGKNQLFLLTDPGRGQTVWLTRDQLASGQTPFPGGQGTLTHTF